MTFSGFFNGEMVSFSCMVVTEVNEGDFKYMNRLLLINYETNLVRFGTLNLELAFDLS